MGYLHYIHGVNPLGLVYLTNMKSAGASHSASTMFHNWFAHGTRWERASAAKPGPPPGYLFELSARFRVGVKAEAKRTLFGGGSIQGSSAYGRFTWIAGVPLPTTVGAVSPVPAVRPTIARRRGRAQKSVGARLPPCGG